MFSPGGPVGPGGFISMPRRGKNPATGQAAAAAAPVAPYVGFAAPAAAAAAPAVAVAAAPAVVPASAVTPEVVGKVVEITGQSKEIIAAIESRISLDLQPVLRDFYKLLWHIDVKKDHDVYYPILKDVVKQILPIKTYESNQFRFALGRDIFPPGATGSDVEIPPAWNKDTLFKTLVKENSASTVHPDLADEAPLSGRVIINPEIVNTNISYTYQDFFPEKDGSLSDATITRGLYPFLNGSGINKFIFIVDTGPNTDVIVKKYPLEGGSPLNLIYAHTRALEMDAASKPVYNKDNDPVWRARFFYEDPETSDNIVRYPSYTINNVRYNKLSDFYCNRDIFLEFTSKNLKNVDKRNLNVAAKYTDDVLLPNGTIEKKLTVVLPGANKAGGLREIELKQYGIKREVSNVMTTISKHHGDVGQVLEQFRNIILKGDAGFINTQTDNYKIAFCTYDLNAAIKAFAEGIDVIFLYDNHTKKLRVYINERHNTYLQKAKIYIQRCVEKLIELRQQIPVFRRQYETLKNTIKFFKDLATYSINKPIYRVGTDFARFVQLYQSYIYKLLQIGRLSQTISNVDFTYLDTIAEISTPEHENNINYVVGVFNVLLKMLTAHNEPDITEAQYTRLIEQVNTLYNQYKDMKVQLPAYLTNMPMLVINFKDRLNPAIDLYSFLPIQIEEELVFEISERAGKPAAAAAMAIGGFGVAAGAGGAGFGAPAGLSAAAHARMQVKKAKLFESINLSYAPSGRGVGAKAISSNFNSAYGISLLKNAFNAIYNYDKGLSQLIINNLVGSFREFDRVTGSIHARYLELALNLSGICSKPGIDCRAIVGQNHVGGAGSGIAVLPKPTIPNSRISSSVSEKMSYQRAKIPNKFNTKTLKNIKGVSQIDSKLETLIKNGNFQIDIYSEEAISLFYIYKYYFYLFIEQNITKFNLAEIGEYLKKSKSTKENRPFALFLSKCIVNAKKPSTSNNKTDGGAISNYEVNNTGETIDSYNPAVSRFVEYTLTDADHVLKNAQVMSFDDTLFEYNADVLDNIQNALLKINASIQIYATSTRNQQPHEQIARMQHRIMSLQNYMAKMKALSDEILDIFDGQYFDTSYIINMEKKINFLGATYVAQVTYNQLIAQGAQPNVATASAIAAVPGVASTIAINSTKFEPPVAPPGVVGTKTQLLNRFSNSLLYTFSPIDISKPLDPAKPILGRDLIKYTGAPPLYNEITLNNLPPALKAQILEGYIINPINIDVPVRKAVIGIPQDITFFDIYPLLDYRMALAGGSGQYTKQQTRRRTIKQQRRRFVKTAKRRLIKHSKTAKRC